ncbi:MAG: alpha-ketoglutarate-dependent dioxygenase AlkB [Saprospiraceae bacterium]|nr:alpha-ketoglutarate-dependent dioxygenase AlkB [Saprospiraceae bacterium]
MKLPLNCAVEYITNFLSKSESKDLYNELIEIHNIDQSRIKIKITDDEYYLGDRKLMFIDEDLKQKNKFPEERWGKSTVWSPSIKRIKDRIEKLTNHTFNVCVCIYYPNGEYGVDFHSDHTAFGDTNFIPSLSIGEEREFHLREKETSDIFEIKLMEGSLLIMGENCQQRFEHSLPINPKYKRGRINLTFRPFGFKENFPH